MQIIPNDEPWWTFGGVCHGLSWVYRVLFSPLGDGLPKVLTKQQEPDTYGNISMDDVKKYGAVTTWADSQSLSGLEHMIKSDG